MQCCAVQCSWGPLVLMWQTMFSLGAGGHRPYVGHWGSTTLYGLYNSTTYINYSQIRYWLRRNDYVSLWDPESTKFQCYLGPSPHDWRILIHFNVVPTVFYIDHISQGVCKTVRTTFQCIVVLQSRGEGPENLSQICPIVMCLFRTFSPRLETNGTLKYSSDSFAHTLSYVVNVENCQNYIEMYHCTPIMGRRS